MNKKGAWGNTMKRTESGATNYRRQSRRISKNALRKRKLRRTLFSFLAIILIAIIAGIMFHKFDSSHFSRGTTINDVDCSWLTPEESYEKLNTDLNEKAISFVFVDDMYTFTGSSFDLTVSSIEELNQLLINQKTVDKQLDFVLSSYSFNETKLTESMKSIPNLKPENMVYPEDAYITLSEDYSLSIIPEITGNHISFDDAYIWATEALKSGFSTIDSNPLTISEPTVKSDDLQPVVDTINNILNTVITFNIGENSVLTLDKSIMKDWLITDDSGNYSIDVDSNVVSFVDLLAEKTATSVVYFDFEATDFGTVTVPAKSLSLNKEAEIELIKSELGTGLSYEHTPMYNLEVGDSYVEIDIARQHVWLYKNGVCIIDTDCVTGNAGNHDTPPGYFFLTGKTMDKILRGYNDNGSKYASHVDYWMPFNGGIGLHDAAWRGAFGGTIYLTNGSHGCVNLPRIAAQTIYENIDGTMPIIVYSSK